MRDRSHEHVQRSGRGWGVFMTMQSIGGSFDFPRLETNASTAASVTLDSTDDYAAVILRAPATGTINKIHVRTASSTLSGTLSCEIQTLDASGNPSGTAYGSSAQADQVNPSGSTTYSFTVDASATEGDDIAIVFFLSALTSGSVQVSTSVATIFTTNFPYLCNRITGTGAGTKATGTPTISIEYSGGVFYECGTIPLWVISNLSIDADGAIRKAGNVIIPQGKISAKGAWAWLDADQNCWIDLIDTDGSTVLRTASIVAVRRTGNSHNFHRVLWDASGAVELAAGSTYRLVINTASTTAFTTRSYTGAPASAHLGQMSGGTNVYMTTHDGSSWTDTNTGRISIGLMVDQISDDAGGGGGGGMIVHPGMSGRLNG